MAKTLIFSTNPSQLGELVAAAKAAGGDAVALDSSALSGMPSEVAVDAIHKAVTSTGATRVFIAGNRRGKEIAARVAVRMESAYIADALSVEDRDGALHFTRKYLGGRTLATESVTGATVVATFAPHAYESAGEPATTEPAQVDASVAVVTVVEAKPREAGEVNIESADLLVAFGRGIKTKGDMQMVFDLAKALGGEVGCTRPIAADLHWLGDDRWIGLSGKNVKPKVYIAVGVSGQIQHLAGCRDASIIVVINTDKSAPFFEHCDYGIVGDLYKVVPALIAALK